MTDDEYIEQMRDRLAVAEKQRDEAKARLVDLLEASHHASEVSYLGEGCDDPWDKARAFLSANTALSGQEPAKYE
jgi:hypothetical protein